MARRPTILFFAKKPMNVVMFRGILGRLRERAEVRCVLSGKFHGTRDGRGLYARAGLAGEKTVPTWWARRRRYDVYICPDFNLVGRRCRVKVHMFHGVSLKNHAISERVRDYDKLFIVGDYMRRTLIARGILEDGDPRIERVGMPKLDALVDGSLPRDQVRESLGLDPDPDLPVVLYAPTWGEGSSLEAWGPEILGALSRLPVQVMVKLHDNSYDRRKTAVDWAERIREFESPRFRQIRDASVLPALAASDVLVSDASSVANEFLLLDRPIVFADCPGLLETLAGKADLETWGRRTGRVAGNARDLTDAVESALSSPGEQHEIRAAAATDLFYEPGGATVKAVSCLLRYAGVA
jgi:CDP-Glycerol:Poly(glycerophosphate) glycerophosphotransferase